MAQYLIPAAFALFVWWFSTGAIVYIDGLPKSTFRRSMLGATVVLAGAQCGLALTSNDQTMVGAYVAFSCALLVWGWQEVAFLLGFITGPRRAPCPPGCGDWRRFSYAVQTILYHELTLVALAVSTYFLTAGGTNHIGLSTFAVLWTMRQSAKLNLFLGVRNLGDQFLPEHLRYLLSYFRRRSMNLLFPVSLVASMTLAAIFWQDAFDAQADAFEVTGLTLVATLLTLAILEHFLMVLPLPAELLWSWGLRSRKSVDRAQVSPIGSALTSWTAPLADPCDPEELHELLEAGARGAFGDVERINGIARARCGWVHFEMVSGRARVSSIVPMEREELRVIAIGRWMDEVRLQAAFDACAVTP